MESFEFDGYFFLKEDRTFTSFKQSSNCEFEYYKDTNNEVKLIKDPMSNTWEAFLVNNDSIFGYGKSYQEALENLKDSENFIADIRGLI